MIELDGSQHFSEDAIAYDTQRTAFFLHNHLQVISFTNTDINQRFQSVCETVEQALEAASAHKE